MLTFPPDITFVIQIVSFFLLWAALKRLTFDPMLRVLAEREKRTKGGLAEASALRAESDAAAQQYEASLREVRHKVSAESEAARQTAQAEQQRVLSAARADADAESARLRTDLAAQVEQARAQLAGEARSIGALMAARVSGRSLA